MVRSDSRPGRPRRNRDCSSTRPSRPVSGVIAGRGAPSVVQTVLERASLGAANRYREATRVQQPASARLPSWTMSVRTCWESAPSTSAGACSAWLTCSWRSGRALKVSAPGLLATSKRSARGSRGDVSAHPRRSKSRGLRTDRDDGAQIVDAVLPAGGEEQGGPSLGRVGPASSVLRVRGMRHRLLLPLGLPTIGAD